MDSIIEIEDEIKEILGFNYVNEYEESPGEIGRLHLLIGRGVSLGSPYSKNLRAIEMYYEWRADKSKDKNSSKALEMLEESARYGYFKCMKILAQEDDIGISPVKRYAYLKLSRTPPGCGYYDLGDFKLNEEEEKAALALYEEMNTGIVEFYMEEWDGF